MNLDKYHNLSKKAQKAKAEADRAEGALDTLMKQLEEEFGCTTVEEGLEKLEELKKQQKKLGRQFNKAVKQFENDWDEKLCELD